MASKIKGKFTREIFRNILVFLFFFPVYAVFWPLALATQAALAALCVLGARAAETRRPGVWKTIGTGMERAARIAPGAFSLALILLFLPVVESFSKMLAAAAAGLLLLGAWRRNVVLHLSAYLIVMLSAFGLYLWEGSLAGQAKTGQTPSWLDPVLADGAAGPECSMGPEAGERAYRIRHIVFEPDESAVYTIAIAPSRGRFEGITAYKIGLAPGVEGACWKDGFTLHAALDAAKRRLYLSQRRDNIVRILDADDFQRIGEIPVKKPAHIQETLPPRGSGILWALNEGFELLAYETESGRLLEERRDFAPHMDFSYDETSAVLYTANFWPRIVSAIDLKQGVPSRKGRPGIGSWGVYAEPASRSVYATDFFLGMAHQLDKRTLGTLQSRRLKAGLRPVLTLPDASLLLTGNLLTGELTVLRKSDLKTLKVLNAGSGIQSIERAPRSGDVYLGTKAGLFRVKKTEVDFKEMK